MLSADEQGGPQGPQGDVWPEPESGALKGVRRGLVREDPTELVKLREENARLKEVLGPGPAVVVGVDSIPALLKHLEGGELNLGIRTWQFPQHAVAYLLEAALEVAKDPANGLCADSVPVQEG